MDFIHSPNSMYLTEIKILIMIIEKSEYTVQTELSGT